MAGVNPHPGILPTPGQEVPDYYAARRHGVQLYSVYNHRYHPSSTAIRSGVLAAIRGSDGVDVGGAERQVEISGRRLRFANMSHRATWRGARSRVQVRVYHRRAQDHRRPGPAATGGGPALVFARRQRRPAVGEGRRLSRGGAGTSPAGSRPAPDPGTEIEGGHDRPVGADILELLLPPGRARARRHAEVIPRTATQASLATSSIRGASRTALSCRTR